MHPESLSANLLKICWMCIHNRYKTSSVVTENIKYSTLANILTLVTFIILGHKTLKMLAILIIHKQFMGCNLYALLMSDFHQPDHMEVSGWMKA